MPALRTAEVRWAWRHDAIPEPKLMRRLPLPLIECIFWLPFIQRPRFLAHSASECPSLEELRRDLIVLEIRGGYLKWAHLSCPKCGEHIQFRSQGRDDGPSMWIYFVGRPSLRRFGRRKAAARISLSETGT
jgi:hypothetical protein